MKIMITFDDQVYYRSCDYAYRWLGVVKVSPDWLTDMIADGDAVVIRSTAEILFKTINGYPRAEVGDVIIKNGEHIDVIRSVWL